MLGKDLNNQEKLEQVYKLTLENNNILHGMRSRERLGNILRVVYWIVIIGALGGVYYYIRPAINVISENRSRVEEILGQFEQLRSQFPEAKALQDLFKQMKSGNTDTSTAN
jgi:hypothetical protein